jgi:hypothetical protein
MLTSQPYPMGSVDRGVEMGQVRGPGQNERSSRGRPGRADGNQGAPLRADEAPNNDYGDNVAAGEQLRHGGSVALATSKKPQPRAHGGANSTGLGPTSSRSPEGEGVSTPPPPSWSGSWGGRRPPQQLSSSNVSSFWPCKQALPC